MQQKWPPVSMVCKRSARRLRTQIKRLLSSIINVFLATRLFAVRPVSQQLARLVQLFSVPRPPVSLSAELAEEMDYAHKFLHPFVSNLPTPQMSTAG